MGFDKCFVLQFGISVEICVSRSSYPTADGARCLEKFRNLSGVGYGSSSVKRCFRHNNQSHVDGKQNEFYHVLQLGLDIPLTYRKYH
ncbi:hypothetical protein MPTK1_6g09870 [Marchantia polymorpha subsp. ruderalis]|uniref:Uncharacterized protein n=2 Tax=Marchantia polymorpha TaxID=3197 RepID=A0AAF6BQE0_MARPO|nr:hypothetical protein MARPO_0016s0031 [Marchantia polymorpha]BBN14224.1 hypothetical protein Mp_6g09870 [Marchantia polymorpha subsp. ruderalis]|eukprot:PTQ44959.1 hypothetical protein MARPO_0016s0031 [Marchantia polymorpha]